MVEIHRRHGPGARHCFGAAAAAENHQPRNAFGVIGLLALVLFGCALRPKWFRGFYRAGMTISFHVGQAIGVVLLTFFFLVVLTPIGLALRLLGKDLLRLKRRPGARSYWLSARTTNRLTGSSKAATVSLRRFHRCANRLLECIDSLVERGRDRQSAGLADLLLEFS